MPVTFALPATHWLTMHDAGTDPGTEDFFIALFGMLKGLRLQREGWQHFYKCPTRRGALCDFYAGDAESAQALEQVWSFWLRHTEASTRNLAFGATHWHLFAQLYQYEFERFNAQYTALDACWVLAQKTLNLDARGQWDRPRTMASALGLRTPGWAQAISAEGRACSLSTRRNALVHEALYADESIGFAHPQTEQGMGLELTNFVARCIFALLGVRNEYMRSPVDTRQCIGFAFQQAGD